MKRVMMKGKFVWMVNSSLVDRIEVICSKAAKTEEGTFPCLVYFKDGSVSDKVYIREWVAATSFGTPVSKEGILYAGGWYSRDGLRAYDVRTGEELWYLKLPRIRNVVLTKDALVTMSLRNGIYRIGLNDGRILKHYKRGGGLGNIHGVSERYILAVRIQSKVALMDAETLEIIHSYPYPTIKREGLRVSGARAEMYIREAFLEGSKLSVEGFINCFPPNSPMQVIEETQVIDENFFETVKNATAQQP